MNKNKSGARNKLAYLKYIAYHDNLTGLRNRTFLYDKLKVREYNHLYFLDIIGLKRVNNNYGHWYGDTYIKTAVSYILSKIGDEDVLIRYGGDEFLLFCWKKVSMRGNGFFSVGRVSLDGQSLEDAIHEANLNMLKRKKG